jgi:hypothetical protein
MATPSPDLGAKALLGLSFVAEPAGGEFAMRFGHAVWQIAGAEQPRFEDFFRVECQAVESADEDGLILDLDPLLEPAADLH